VIDDPTLNQYNRPVDIRPIDAFDGGQRRLALRDKTCLMGKHHVSEAMFDTFSEAGKREYNMSAVCEPCFDQAFADD
jgi:hypothetical protein